MSNKCLKALTWKAAYHNFSTNKMFVVSAKRKTQQIKYYWGWCHPHKNAWKLGKHVSSTRTFLCRLLLWFQLKNVQQFLRWRLIFHMVFQSIFQSLSRFSSQLPVERFFLPKGCWGKIYFLPYFTSVSLRSWNTSDIHDVGIKPSINNSIETWIVYQCLKTKNKVRRVAWAEILFVLFRSARNI